MKTCFTLFGAALLAFSLTSVKAADAATAEAGSTPVSVLEGGDPLFEKGRVGSRSSRGGIGRP